jgi:hypothetical protein
MRSWEDSDSTAATAERERESHEGMEREERKEEEDRNVIFKDSSELFRVEPFALFLGPVGDRSLSESR